MRIISRGFSRRRIASNGKLPPGQYLTTDFPVLPGNAAINVFNDLGRRYVRGYADVVNVKPEPAGPRSSFRTLRAR